MPLKRLILVVAVATCVLAQRPSFAGFRPIGYPDVTTAAPIAAAAGDLGNRFGEDNVTTTTQKLPVEAKGDKDLVDRLSKLPVDNQPFWFINSQALDANRKNPQTYPFRPSHFAQPLHPNPTSGTVNTNTGPPIPNTVPTSFSSGFQTNVNVANANRFESNNPETTPSGASANVDTLGNKNGETVTDVYSNSQGSTLKPVDNLDTIPTFGNRFNDDSDSKDRRPTHNKDSVLNAANSNKGNNNKGPVSSPVQVQPSINAHYNPLENLLLNSQYVNRNPTLSGVSQSNYGSQSRYPVNINGYPNVYGSRAPSPLVMTDVGKRFDDQDYDFEVNIHPQVDTQKQYYSPSQYDFNRGSGGYPNLYY